MRWLAITSLALGAALGGNCLWLIARADTGPALLCHLGGWLVGSLGLWLWLRAVDCRQRGLYGLTLFMAGVIPGFTLLALPLAAAYGARNPVQEEEESTLLVGIPRLPFKPLELDRVLAFSRGGLFDVLERSSDVDKQVLAVMATTRMKAKQAIPLLKVAMKDEVDDVRLLAYSIKEKIESEINRKIKSLLTVLEADEPPGQRLARRERAATERSLAFLYWELVYLELAEGDIREFYVEQVVKLAKASLAELPYGPLSVLLARAFLEQGYFGAASDALDDAERGGVASHVLAPYRAEIAFYQRRYRACAQHLREIGPTRHEALADVIEYWLAAA